MADSAEALQTIWLKADDPSVVQILDQRQLPHRRLIYDLKTAADGAFAIREMLVRGAPLIGATAAWSLYLAALGASAGKRGAAVEEAAPLLEAARPTAVNLHWAIQRVLTVARDCDDDSLIDTLRNEAQAICDEDAEISRRIGQHGLRILEDIAARKNGAPVNAS